MNYQILEKRLVNYSSDIINFFKNLTYDKHIEHFKNQLIRSSTSVSLNYGEARSSETKKDFIHKTSIVLKELRESYNALSIIYNVVDDNKTKTQLKNLLRENNELISIFVTTVNTSRKNLNLNQKSRSKSSISIKHLDHNSKSSIVTRYSFLFTCI